jgi:hypothetical protein
MISFFVTFDIESLTTEIFAEGATFSFKQIFQPFNTLGYSGQSLASD